MNSFHFLLGTAIGDAFGAGVEFQDRNWILKNIDFTKYVNVRNQIQVPENQLSLFVENFHDWQYTDDTEMTIGTIKALVSSQPFTEKLLIENWQNEYEKGKIEKGYGRNGHGSMSWYYSGEKTIEEIKNFQRERPNPGNAPAMRAVPIGLVDENKINEYAAINANATHPNNHAIISSQCIARVAHFLLVKEGRHQEVITYCMETVSLNEEYQNYLQQVDALEKEERLSNETLAILCGPQPIQKPYFLDGINGLPSDSKYTTGAVLYLLKHYEHAFDVLKQSVNLGGDVDSAASIATGIIAARYGIDSIPIFMQEQVEGVQYLKSLSKTLDKLLM